MITTVEVPTSRCRFGMARVDITPPAGIYHRMWGAARQDRATGVHQPLFATAVAWAELHDLAASAPFVLVALDHCLLWPAEMAELRAAVLDHVAIPPERLLITFSHTHGAGLIDRGRSHLPGGELLGPYFSELCRRAAACARQAVQQLAPVTITYGAGKCSLAGHRDFWDERSRQWVLGWNPDGPADETVLVARITAANDTPMAAPAPPTPTARPAASTSSVSPAPPAPTPSPAPSTPSASGRQPAETLVATVVNYACHPTSLAWENSLISPDYVGALRDTIERCTGAPCLFLQGASGDLGPRYGFVGDPAVADRNGRQLAYAALSALEGLPPPNTRQTYVGPVVSGATIGVWVYEPCDAEQQERAKVFACRRVNVPLPYRADRPALPDLERERGEWQAKEQAALSAGDDRTAQEARAMVERCTRAITRWSQAPAGDTFPYELTFLRLGDAVWVFGEGELYQDFQRELRRRCPQRTLIIGELADGWRCTYLPTRDTYGKGIYEEQVALLAPGCLERVIDAAVASLASL
jgi:hypothetical protein